MLAVKKAAAACGCFLSSVFDWGVFLVFTEIDGLKIHYIDEGEGSPVLLIHGWGSSILPWKPIMAGFFGHRTVALDLPGCGESDILKTDWGIEDYCEFILKFMKAVNLQNPIMVGHSHGGRIILNMACEKMISPPKIVLFDSAGIPAKKTLKKRAKVFIYKSVKKFLMLPIFKGKNEELLKKAQSHFGSADYRSAPEVMRKTMVRVINTDIREKLSAINCPTLLIWGENDADTPLSDAKYLEQHIKDCGLCVIEGAGHFSFLQDPQKTVAILKSFLN